MSEIPAARAGRRLTVQCHNSSPDSPFRRTEIFLRKWNARCSDRDSSLRRQLPDRRRFVTGRRPRFAPKSRPGCLREALRPRFPSRPARNSQRAPNRTEGDRLAGGVKQVERRPRTSSQRVDPCRLLLTHPTPLWKAVGKGCNLPDSCGLSRFCGAVLVNHRHLHKLRDSSPAP